MITKQNYLISGGSRGLGFKLCEELLVEGHSVSTFARSSTQDVSELQNKYPDQIYFKEVDMSKRSDVESFVRESVSKFGNIDCLIHNAAIGQDDLLAHMSAEKIESLVSTNILGSVYLTKSVIKNMLVSEGGRVIFISSICSIKGFPGLSIYSGSKAFLDAFSRSLLIELKGSSIFINTISPGFFESEMSSVLSEKQLRRIRENTPSGFLTEVDDVIRAVNYLRNAANANGTNIVIDGGVTS